MTNITIKRVTTKKDMKRFCSFPLKLYKGCPYYVPSFFVDELKLLDEKLYGDFTKSFFFLAIVENKVVGRIAAIINYAHNEKTNQKNIRFSRFDCIDDFEVASALFDKCVEIAKENGLTTVLGPLGYTDFDREGMLYYGFDQMATYGTTYNYDYYPKLVEKYGFRKAFDWFERTLDVQHNTKEDYVKIAPLIAERYQLKELVHDDTKMSKIIAQKGQEFFDLINICYKDLEGTVPITQKVIDDTLATLTLVLQPRYISFVQNSKGELVAAGVAMKSIAKALNKCGGKFLPTGIFRILSALSKKNKQIELLLIAVRPDYQSKGVTSMIISKIYTAFKEDGIESVETNLTLENNHPINNQWNNFTGRIHKKRRCYTLDV